MANSLSRARSQQPKAGKKTASRSKAPSSRSDASRAADDSAVKKAAQNAADGKRRVHPDDGAVKRWELAFLVDDYTKLPAIGLQAALLRHLDVVTQVIQEGKIDCLAHVGMIAASFERLCAQCVERQYPTKHTFGGLDWDCEEFSQGFCGDCVDHDVIEALNRDMDEALRRDYPEFFKDEDAA